MFHRCIAGAGDKAKAADAGAGDAAGAIVRGLTIAYAEKAGTEQTEAGLPATMAAGAALHTAAEAAAAMTAAAKAAEAYAKTEADTKADAAAEADAQPRRISGIRIIRIRGRLIRILLIPGRHFAGLERRNVKLLKLVLKFVHCKYLRYFSIEIGYWRLENRKGVAHDSNLWGGLRTCYSCKRPFYGPLYDSGAEHEPFEKQESRLAAALAFDIHLFFPLLAPACHACPCPAARSAHRLHTLESDFARLESSTASFPLL